jgi:hypothetical protein
MKSPEVMQDEVVHCFVWAWSLKDYLKALATSKGKDSDFIDSIVNSDINLQLCADLANVEKHGMLSWSRSGIFPKFDDVSFSVPMRGLKQLIVGANDVTIDIDDASKVEVSLPIIANDGTAVADGFTVLDLSLAKWENVFADLKVAA